MDNQQRDDVPSGETVRVSIFDQIYSLRSPKGAEHIRKIAQVVDERMRLIAMQTTTFELSRMAVLAALNLADELEDFKTRREAAEASTDAATDAASAPETTAAAARTESVEAPQQNQTWFDAIFDAEVPVKERSQRLSSQVSNRLQNIKQDNSRGPASPPPASPTTEGTE